MGDEGVSDQVRTIILEHISSVAQLEILLLLHMNPKQAWPVSEIARELRIEIAGAKLQLTSLVASGLVKQDPANPENYQFAPQTPALEEGTLALAQAYLVRRVTVIGLIFNKPSDKIRAFSDAFRLRKDPPRG